MLSVLFAPILLTSLAQSPLFAADSEVRCGLLAKHKTGKFQLMDCMIARPRFDRRYEPAAGWQLCVLTHGPLTRDVPALSESVGKQVCVSGQHQGLGQFKADRLVAWELRYEPDPERGARR